MSRIRRVIFPGCPHHIIQRGNRRQKVFFSDNDKFVYMKFLKDQAFKYKLDIWAYCLLDNHVHLIAVPTHQESFKAIAETHRRYTQMINSREGWRGYLWQGRFISFPMDEAYCYRAVRYVENNPVRARLVKEAQDYLFSSAKYHIYGSPNKLISRCFLQNEIKDWKAYLGQEDKCIDEIRKHSRTGRPLGSEGFICKIEEKTGRNVRKQKPGPKVKVN